MEREIRMPRMSGTTEEVVLLTWKVRIGDTVKRGDVLCVVETDKTTLDVESVEAGVVRELRFAESATVLAGEVIAVLGGEGQSAAPPGPPATPMVRNLAAKRGIDLSRVRGTGPGGLVTRADLEGVTAPEPAAPAPGREGTTPEHARLLAEIGTERAIAMLATMIRIRVFEEQIRLLFLEGAMPGTVHQSIGQEACAAGVCAALDATDVILSTHRPHGHAVARGLPMRSLMAELYGKAEGCCRGRGGSMHLGDLERGMVPAIAIVGGNIPIAAGIGLAFKMRREKRVAVCFFGDGAANEGAFHEGLNMAAIWDAPVVFVCENNQYGASTPVGRVMRIKDIAQRADAYGMQGSVADGMDVYDVFAHARAAVEHARAGRGPVLLELKTFRLCGHSRRDSNAYMDEKVKEYWRARDPIPAAEKLLADRSLLGPARLQAIRAEAAAEVADAVAFAQAAPEPDPAEGASGLYATGEVRT